MSFSPSLKKKNGQAVLFPLYKQVNTKANFLSLLKAKTMSNKIKQKINTYL